MTLVPNQTPPDRSGEAEEASAQDVIAYFMKRPRFLTGRGAVQTLYAARLTDLMHDEMSDLLVYVRHRGAAGRFLRLERSYLATIAVGIPRARTRECFVTDYFHEEFRTLMERFASSRRGDANERLLITQAAPPV